MEPRRGRSRRPLVHALFVLVALAVAWLAPRAALAGGTVTVSTREPVESDGKWKIAMSINMGSKPDLPHVPFNFTFTPTVHYDLALTDKSPDKPVLTKIPLSNQQGITFSMDVGFADPTGKVFNTTKFDFAVRRDPDRGVEAGEYDLVVKRASDNVQIGSTLKITLKGDNPVVDRRAIVFSGEKKPKDKPAADADKPKDNANGDTDKKPEEQPAGDAPKEGEGNAPPPVPPKQGGCGCRAAGEPVSSSWVALAMAASIVAAGARRRSRRSRGARV